MNQFSSSWFQTILHETNKNLNLTSKAHEHVIQIGLRFIGQILTEIRENNIDVEQALSKVVIGHGYIDVKDDKLMKKQLMITLSNKDPMPSIVKFLGILVFNGNIRRRLYNRMQNNVALRSMTILLNGLNGPRECCPGSLCLRPSRSLELSF